MIIRILNEISKKLDKNISYVAGIIFAVLCLGLFINYTKKHKDLIID